MSFLQRIFGRGDRRKAYEPLYRAIVALARDPAWYRDGQVPDTIDGRFDMLAAVTALVLLRLEAEGEAAREASALLTETFVADMDASLRQIGIGDYVVGKHIGRLMGALGGRLGALREAQERGLEAFAIRNIFHERRRRTRRRAGGDAMAVRDALRGQPLDALLAGRVPHA